MRNLIAQSSPFGTIEEPEALRNLGGFSTGPGALLTLVVRLLVVIAGLYALINFVLAGYAFLAAGDDPKRIEGAWAKIWQSVVGLIVSAGSVLLAAIFGRLIFGEWTSILSVRLPTI